MIVTLFSLFFLLYGFVFALNFTGGLRLIVVRGFIIILLFETVLAAFTGAIQCFEYNFYLWAHLLINLLAIINGFLLYKKKRLAKFTFKKSYFFPLILIMITFFQLWSTHYNYSGKSMTMHRKVVEVTGLNYPLPFVVDEWYHVALSKYMFKSKSLPTIVPLVKIYSEFRNVQMPFHLFNSSLFQILRLDPLYSYVPLMLVMNSFLIVLCYMILRQWGLSEVVCLFTSLSITHLSHGANLMTLWSYMPINLGIILVLCFFFFHYTFDKLFFNLSAVLSIIFYPPLLVFVFPSYLFSAFLC